LAGMRSPRRAAAVGMVAVTMLVGCTGGAENSSDTEMSPAVKEVVERAPTCEKVRSMDNLPANYEGCTNASGDLVAAAFYDCKNGTRMYVVAEGPPIWTKGEGLNLVTGDESAYAAAVEHCQGS
jgi:hypothetical protein